MSITPTLKRRAAIGAAVILIAQLMLILDTTIVNVALPTIDAGLGFSTATLSLVVNGYGLAFGALMLVGGRLGDMFGRRRVFQLGLAIFILSSLLGGLAQTPEWLIISRAVQGVGGALIAPGVLALLFTTAVDETARHRALARFAAVGIGGGALGLLLGGLLTEYASWRWTLLVNVPLGLIVLFSLPWLVDETPRLREPFDFAGAGLTIAASVSIVWGLIGAPIYGWTSWPTLVALAIGVVLLGALALTERHVRFPLLNPALLRDRSRVGALIVTTAVFAGQFAMFFLGAQYVQRVLGLTPLAAGAAFLPMTVGILISSHYAPTLVARFGQRALLIAGTTGLVMCFAWLSIAGEHSGYWSAVFGPVLLNGLAAGLTFMPAASLVLGNVAPEHTGAASGMLQTMQQLGGAIDLAVIASVYASQAVAQQFVPGFEPALLTCSGFALLSVLAAVFILPTRRHANRLLRESTPTEDSTELAHTSPAS